MSYLYTVREDTMYGVNIVDTETGEILDSAPGVFITQQEAENFAQLCNSEDLSPIHLKDVVHNILS